MTDRAGPLSEQIWTQCHINAEWDTIKAEWVNEYAG